LIHVYKNISISDWIKKLFGKPWIVFGIKLLLNFRFQSLSFGSWCIIEQFDSVFEASSFNLRAIVWIEDFNSHGLDIVVLDSLSKLYEGWRNRPNIEWHVNENFSLTGVYESREVFVNVCNFLIVLIVE